METKGKTFYLKNFTKDQLRVLASDIRADILSVCLSNGGHLSSNLGVVELTISLLRNFSPDKNDILFDVGHQSYTYKILTGRDVTSIRKTDGIAPFNLREESDFDRYSNGHSGDCISTAIGMAIAKNADGKDDSFTIAFVGDASIENGISYEAIDYLSSHKDIKNLIIVLNDNGMAISKNKGPISSKFAHLRNSRFYFRTSSRLGRKMEKHKLTWKMFLQMRALKDHLKGMVISPTVYESLGLKYIGPYDGHDFDSLDLAFEKARLLSRKQPVLLHVQTKKGFGYPLASKDESGNFHGVKKAFDEPNSTPNQQFTSIKESLLYGPMKKDRRIYVITPAMEKGSGLERIFADFPDRSIDTGISEEHALVLASGLALKGKIPVLDIYSTFLQRCYDELLENVSRNHVPLLLLVERCGLVGEDGSSHHGIYDVAMVKGIPYRRVLMPFDVNSIQYCFMEYQKQKEGPFLIRFPKGNPVFNVPPCEIKNGICFFNRKQNRKLCLGVSCLGYELVSRLDDSFDKGILIDLLMDDAGLDSIGFENYEDVYLYDAYSTFDGTTSHIAEYLLRRGFQGRFHPFAFHRDFIPFGNNDDLLEKTHMDVDSVIKSITEEKE